jgi:multisubunit Na+/H+ antiporter MnhC subunit
VGLGLFGAIVHPQPLRKILAFNLLGGGVFLVFGVIARRGAGAGMGGRCSAAGEHERGPRCGGASVPVLRRA